MSRQLAIIGLGRFGISVAREATAIGDDVLAIDKDGALVDMYKDQVAHAVRANATDRDALRPFGLDSMDGVIIAIGRNDLDNIMVSMHLLELGVGNVISRASSEIHAEILKKVGVRRVVLPERDTGVRIAHTYAVPQDIEYMELTADHGVSKFKVPGDMVGKNVWDSRLTTDFRLSVLALIRDNELIINPAQLNQFREGDSVVVAGDDEDLIKVQHLDAKG